ncbi:MAG TPA: DUF262 domain-containing protein [Tenuifilaceae bacterium]|nr:DUF262 domain-containing protein [Tenuifilaceae bacterium]
MEDKLTIETKKLSELFDVNFSLTIPDYQRAYEWRSYHVKNLLNDTYSASRRNTPYLMGTIILNQTNHSYEIIDGQQRLITLSILMNYFSDKDHATLMQAKFNNLKSFYYIKNTQNEIAAFFNNKYEKSQYLEYIKENLLFSVLTISGANAIDQAYTFFDSVNSKGKELTDFDLLKAHHLMYIPEELEQLARKHNDFWLSKNHKHHELFGRILRRIRMWSRGLDRDNNSERNDFYEFISTVEPNEIEQNEHLFNRYMQPNVFRSWHRENDEVVLNMKYPQVQTESLIPFEVPQTIEGGDSFFLYAKRYHEIFEQLFGENSLRKSSFINYVYELSKSIDNEYIAMACKAIILLYYDKFGESRIIEVATCTELIISKIRFRWGNTRPSPLRIETTLSRVKDKNIIPIILNSTIASHVVSLLISNISLNKIETKESPTLKSYKSKMGSFYRANKSKLKNNQLLEKINFIYELD